MTERRIARRYAKALIEAVGVKNIQIVDRDIALAEEIWDKSPVVRALFSNPALKKQERIKKVESIIKNFNFSETTKNFFRLLAINNRLNLLPTIIEIAKELSDEVQKRVRVEYITSSGVKKETIDTLKGVLEEKLSREVLIKPEIDKKIIGGAILKIKGTVFDGSLITRLNRLKEKLKEAENGTTSR